VELVIRYLLFVIGYSLFAISVVAFGYHLYVSKNIEMAHWLSSGIHLPVNSPYFGALYGVRYFCHPERNRPLYGG